MTQPVEKMVKVKMVTKEIKEVKMVVQLEEKVVLLPLLLGGRRPGVRMKLPAIGEHTDEVLGAELGLTADELAALRADGVIG